MDLGELFSFTKDFKFKLNKTDVNAIFRQVSATATELDYQQFTEALVPLAIKSIQARTIELKYRLREIK